MQFFYQINFSSLKVLKGLVEQIPIPKIKDKDMSRKAASLAKAIDKNHDDSEARDQFDDLVFNHYGLSKRKLR